MGIANYNQGIFFMLERKKSEAIVIKNRGGKVLEVRIIPHGKQGKTSFATDNVVSGSMETKTLPESFNDLVEWLDRSGKLREIEKMVVAIVR